MMDDHFITEASSGVAADDAVRTILEENARRNAENSRLFDPVSGEGSVGSRFLFDVRGLSRSWLPDTMRGERMIGSLAASDDVDLYLRKELGRTPTQRDRERLASRLDRLRMLHDFPYWAATRAYIKDTLQGATTCSSVSTDRSGSLWSVSNACAWKGVRSVSFC